MKQQSWRGKKILIINQNIEAFISIATLLEEEGFECLHAADGCTGIDIAHRLHPDVILMDWSVPDLGGHQVIEQLKTAKDTRIIPVILLIGSNISNVELCFELCNKVDDYIRKPVDKFELIGRIGANLRLYRIINLVQERSERLAKLNYQLQEVDK